jgi:hypothetical protein
MRAKILVRALGGCLVYFRKISVQSVLPGIPPSSAAASGAMVLSGPYILRDLNYGDKDEVQFGRAEAACIRFLLAKLLIRNFH